MVVHARAGGTIEIMGLMQGSNGKPVAAITIYKCLLHWRTFEAEKTNIFDRLIQIFNSAMQKQDSNANLAYWLSNASSLLIILQKSLKPAGSGVITPLKRTTTQTSFLGRMVFRASSITVDMDLVRQVEGKYPAFLFKQQLTAFVEGLYGMIHDNVKSEVSSVLSHVIQVPTIFSRKIFTQIFAFINAQLFNSLLVRRECCSFSNGEYLKQGLEIHQYCLTVKYKQYAGSAWDELKHISQAVGFLVIFKKFRVSYDEIMSDLCPVLSVHQLYRICTQYWDDKYNTESVSEEFDISSMKNSV
ncbi:myosin-8-like [Hordeum vulgare subsp. vulgare]|uniref:myosin-8-like n=1 Tax=Hordeum vulgare subsp. vulgare TaxID=112509 RepID=UPI001D1A4EB2|nr:myosin-8-like [Hordeum vulgare subsp. vulgare]